MPEFRGFVAHVRVDGQNLAEYAETTTVNTDGVTLVSCWVPSEAGKPFSVHWVDTRTSATRTTTSGYVYADGVFIGGRFCEPSGTNQNDVADKTVGGMRHSILFSELSLTDDDSALRAGGLESLGEIVLKVMPTVKLGTVIARPDNHAFASGKVHERSKKAGTHRIQLGSALGAASGTTADCRRVGPDLVHFVFRYRPLGLLQATEIAPAPPRRESPPPVKSPSRRPSPSPKPELTAEELAEEQRLRARLDELSRKRGAPSASGSRKKVKTEVLKSEPLSHAGRFTDGDVIDLSED